MDERLQRVVSEMGLSVAAIEEPSVLAWYSGQTWTELARSPSLALRPKSTDEVQRIVETANKHGIPLIPVSSGTPRLRCDSEPKVEGALIVDLREMNSILRVDRKNRVAMIQPGVTFTQLSDELAKHSLRPLMPLLPKCTKSVVASCLDREPITMPRFHWDSSDPLLCTEVVFGSGELFRTGSAAGPGTLEEQWASGQAQKNPQGPSQFDPFRILQGSQGTIGIVTWATVKCEPLPERHEVLMSGADDLRELLDFTYSIAARRLADELLILNRAAFSCALESTSDRIDALSDEVPAWILVVGLSAYGLLAAEEFDYRFNDTLEIARTYGMEIREKMADITGEMVRSTVVAACAEPYWKLRRRGGCIEVSFLTTLDMAPHYYSLVKKVALKRQHPIEDLGVYVQPTLQGTNAQLCLDIYYDKADRTLTTRAKDFGLAVSRSLLKEGAYFSCPYGPFVKEVFTKTSPEVVAVMRSVKSIFDPRGIMNPGTLCFPEVV